MKLRYNLNRAKFSAPARLPGASFWRIGLFLLVHVFGNSFAAHAVQDVRVDIWLPVAPYLYDTGATYDENYNFYGTDNLYCWPDPPGFSFRRLGIMTHSGGTVELSAGRGYTQFFDLVGNPWYEGELRDDGWFHLLGQVTGSAVYTSWVTFADDIGSELVAGRLWAVVDLDTWETSDWMYVDEGFQRGVSIPGSGLPDLPVKVMPSELRVLNKASVSSDFAVKGTARVYPRGGLSMGEFTQGPRP